MYDGTTRSEDRVGKTRKKTTYMTWQRKHMVESMQHGIERVCAIACVRDIDHVNDAAEKQYTFNYLLDDIHDRTTTT